jgi:hypothetical protein
MPKTTDLDFMGKYEATKKLDLAHKYASSFSKEFYITFSAVTSIFF